jgi:hypothetical protein
MSRVDLAAVEEAVAQAKTEIRADVANGHVPRTVASFSELHDYVDANEYGGLCNERSDWTNEQGNDVQTRLDEWIKSGVLRIDLDRLPFATPGGEVEAREYLLSKEWMPLRETLEREAQIHDLCGNPSKADVMREAARAAIMEARR